MKRRSAPVRLLFDLFGMNIRNMSTDGVTVSCPLRKNLKPGPVRSYACWGLGCSSSPVSSHCARRRWAQFAFRILRKPAVRVVRGRSSGVRRATDHRISPVLVERGGSDHRAVRVDPGGPRLGPHGRSQTLRTRRWVYGRDTSWAACVRCPRGDQALPHLCRLGRRACLTGRKEYSMTKAVGRTTSSTSTRNFGF